MREPSAAPIFFGKNFAKGYTEDVYKRQRLEQELNGAYTVSTLSQMDFEALLAAYDEAAMGDFEDYLGRELEQMCIRDRS